jgi:hypothetical protein
MVETITAFSRYSPPCTPEDEKLTHHEQKKRPLKKGGHLCAEIVGELWFLRHIFRSVQRHSDTWGVRLAHPDAKV